MNEGLVPGRPAVAALRRRPVLLAAGVLAWGGAVAAGFAELVRYEHRAGALARPAVASARVAPGELARDVPTLLLFLHPRCPCSVATIEELNRLLARRAGALAVTAHVYADPALGADWARGALWNAARSLPGVDVREDLLGATARRFDARVSGQALLFAPDGALLFSGGLTGSRGHAGDNPGRAAVEALLDGAPAGPTLTTPVFGCALRADAEAP